MIPMASIRSVSAQVTSGGTPSRAKPEYFAVNGSGHLWVKSKELQDGVITDAEERISDEGLNGSSAKYLPAFTVLLAMYGANVGQLGWLRVPATVNQAICGLIINPDKADFRYVFYALMETRAGLIAQAQGAAQQNLNQDKIKDFEIPCPDLPTQRRIASILSAYDDLIENNTRRIAILEEMARRIYEEWFVRFRFPGHENVRMVESELGLVPEGWRYTTLGKSADIQWGDTSKTKASYTDDGYAAYSASGLDGKMASFDFHRDGIVLSAIGARCGLTWFARGQWSCIKNTIRFWSSDVDRMCNEYLYLATLGMEFWPRRGAAQPFISLGDARACALVLPPADLMKAFREVARPTLELADKLERKNSNLRTTRDFLLPKLISGELDVSALPEPEAAAA